MKSRDIKLILTIIPILLINGVYCQAIMTLDSLQQELPQADKNDSVNILYSICNIYYDLGDYDRAMEYFLSAMEKLDQQNNFKAKADVLIVIGNIYFEQQKFQKVIFYYLCI